MFGKRKFVGLPHAYARRRRQWSATPSAHEVLRGIYRKYNIPTEVVGDNGDHEAGALRALQYLIDLPVDEALHRSGLQDVICGQTTPSKVVLKRNLRFSIALIDGYHRHAGSFGMFGHLTHGFATEVYKTGHCPEFARYLARYSGRVLR